MSLGGDGRQSGDELVVRDAQVVHQLPALEVPHQQGERLLRLVATDADTPVLRDYQGVQETVLANLPATEDGTLRQFQVDIGRVSLSTLAKKADTGHERGKSRPSNIDYEKQTEQHCQRGKQSAVDN